MVAGRQTNVCVNTERGLAFFEGEDLAYNYKTGQWTALPAYDGLQYFGINRKNTTCGLIRTSGTAYALEEQDATGVAQDATIETGETDLNPDGRSFVQSIRPLVDGGTVTVRVGTRANLTDAVSYTASTSLTSDTGLADFRSESRYHRVEITITGGFTTALGAYVNFEPVGRV